MGLRAERVNYVGVHCIEALGDAAAAQRVEVPSVSGYCMTRVGLSVSCVSAVELSEATRVSAMVRGSCVSDGEVRVSDVEVRVSRASVPSWSVSALSRRGRTGDR